MNGGAEHRLNIGAFPRYLQLEHFRNVQCIFIPCGKNKGLLVNDIKQACPSVQTIVHSKWLMVMGRWRRYRKEKDAINATECIGMTWVLQRVGMHGCKLPGTKSANLFQNHCLLCLLFYNNVCGLISLFKILMMHWVYS